MVSYDIKAPFTFVPVDSAISTIQNRLHQDYFLPQRTSMSIAQIITLLEFCLRNSYSLFQGKNFEQVHGVTMGSPISPFIASLLMEEFKIKARSSAPTLTAYGQGMWMTPLLSRRQNTVTSSSSTSTHWTHISNLPPRTPKKMVLYLTGHPGFLKS